MRSNRKRMIAAALTAALSTPVWAQPSPMGPGCGMEPGMMGGHGMGPGMMGGYGLGPGMMGSHGMGPGMMGGYGMGAGTGWGFAALNLTESQRAKITEIRRESAAKHWALMGTVHEQRFRLNEWEESGRFDDAAARKAYESMAEARKQMFETRLEARRRIDAVLTPEQREQLRRGGRGAGHSR